MRRVRANSDSLIGTTIADRYVVERRLGQGGMGAIYVATQIPLGRPVVLKVLLESLASDDVAVARFEKEALAVSKLLHPNVVTLFDFGQTPEGALYIAMEYLPGRSLREVLIDDGALPWARTLPIVSGIAKGLSEAHRQGIIHRDLKPENVMIVPTGTDGEFPKLLDFGLARTLEPSTSGAVKLTEQNMIPGTPTYLAPERANAVTDDHRGDLYSLGALWYELVVGRPPFEDENPIKIIVKHIQEMPVPPRMAAPHAGIPAGVEAVILKLLMKRPEHRHASANDVVKAVNDLESPEAWSVATLGAPHMLRSVPDVFDEISLADLKDLEFRSLVGDDEVPVPLTKKKPIALTQRKTTTVTSVDDGRTPAALSSPPKPRPHDDNASLPPQDTGVVRIPSPRPAKGPSTGPTLETTGPIASVADAATWLARAQSLDDAMQVLGRYLAAHFDRGLVLDVQDGPRLVAHHGTRPISDVARLIRSVPSFMTLAAEPVPYIGPPRQESGWAEFHLSLSGREPATVVLASLRRQGAPAIVLYAESDTKSRAINLPALATVVKEAAATFAMLAGKSDVTAAR